MRINNNMMSVNTHRVLGINQNSTANSIEKLSSGLRINRAGDDAAGLAISEKMRAQIRGLNMASRNAQDAISLIQTAEGATNEVHEILQRMRQLSVQSANDTNVTEDRIQIQSEIDQLTQEVDRIAQTTEFNGITLLNGAAGQQSISQSTVDALTAALPALIDDAMDAIESYMSIDAPIGVRPLAIEYYYDDTLLTGASMGTNNGGASLTMRVNLANVTDANGALIPTDSLDGLIAHEMMHGYQFVNMDFSTDAFDQAKETWFLEGLSMAIQGGNFFPVTDHTVTATASFDGDYRSAYEAVKVMHELIDGGINALINRLELGDSLDTAIDTVVWNAGGTDIGTADGGNTVASINDVNSFLTYFNNSTDVDAFLGRTAAGQEFDPNVSGVISQGGLKGSASALNLADTISNDASAASATASFNITFTNPNFAGSGGNLTMQIGANENQTMLVQLGNVAADNLGINNLDLTTTEGSVASITALDTAINSVSNIRSRLGATQNRLEHTIKNLDVSAENLQSAESRIRDIDMAKEMMRFTKSNILTQASQAMLAQANQAPQGILQLLR